MTYQRLEVAVGDRPTITGDDVIYLDLRDCGIRPFVQHDMTTPLPFADEQFTWIQACHCLEHCCYADTDRVLAQWAAKLAHQGVLHIEVPDVAYQAQRILANPLDDEAIIFMYGTQVDMPDGMNQHRTAFTAQLLGRGMERAGLQHIWVQRTGGCLVAEGRRVIAGRPEKITVVNITRRRGGLDILTDSLIRQTALPVLRAEGRIELLIVDEHAHDPARREAVKRVHDDLDIPITHIYPPDYAEPMYCKLARANSAALQAAKGDILVLINDFMVVPDHALQTMLDTLESLPYDALLTTICHHAGVPSLDDVGDLNDPYSIFAKPFVAEDYGFPHVEPIWRDPRVDMESPTTNPFAWEANVAAVRTSLLRRAGGAPEAYDDGVGADNVMMAARVMLTTPGSQVFIAKDVVCHSANHYNLLPNPREQVLAEARNQRRIRVDLAAMGFQLAIPPPEGLKER